MVPDQNRRKFLRDATIAGVAGLAGIGQVGAADQAQTRLSWHAGGTGGTYFPLSNEIKTIVEDNTQYRLNVQSTGASVENVGNLGSQQADFALIQNDIAYFARNGTGIEVFNGNPVPNIRGVATLYPETITIVTLQGTNIEQLSDLEGATINTGDLGSGTQVNALQILEAVGIQNFQEQNASFSQAADQLRNGDIDAAFVVGGYPVGAIADLATTNNIRLVPIAGENREAVKNAATWFSNDTIPAGVYNGVDEPVETVAVQAMIATRQGLDEGTVQDVTAAIFDNVDQLTIKTEFIGAESAMDGMSIILHPGAAAYFDRSTAVPTTTPSGNETGNATGNETTTAPSGSL